jgi:hypothetical protein
MNARRLAAEERFPDHHVMNPTTRSAIHDGGRTATRLTRRAANAVTLVVVAFWALFVFSAELPSVAPTDPALALSVWLLYVGILAIGVVSGYTLLGQYLRLIRCERTANSVRSRFSRGAGPL